MSLKITWKEGPAYPTLIKGTAAGAIDGRLLVAGGMSYPWREVEYGFWLPIPLPADPLSSGEKIEKAVAEWNSLASLPIGPGWTSGAAVAGGLVIVGGRRNAVGNKATADVLFLDAFADGATWERLPDRPTSGMVATTCACDPFLYSAFGSEWHPNEHAIEDTSIYRINILERNDNMASGWEVVTRFPGAPRWMGCMTICNGKLYVIGGRDQPVGGFAAIEIQPHNAYDPDNCSGELVTYREMWEYDLETNEWQELAHPPRAFVTEGVTIADRWIVLAGGDNYVVYPEGVSARILRFNWELDLCCHSREVWAYDTQTGEWTILDPLPYGIASARMAVCGDYVYTVGNETLDKNRSNTYSTVFEGHIEVEW